MQFIDKVLRRICFASNIEPSIKKNDSYLIDLSKDTGREKIRKDFGFRYNYVKEYPKLALSIIRSLHSD